MRGNTGCNRAYLRISLRQVLFPGGDQPSLYLSDPGARDCVTSPVQDTLDTCFVVLRSPTQLDIASSGVTIFHHLSLAIIFSSPAKRQRKLITRKEDFSRYFIVKCRIYHEPFAAQCVFDFVVAIALKVSFRAKLLRILMRFFSDYSERYSCVGIMKSCSVFA